MAVRTAYVGTEAVGDVLTKANFDKLPGGWIGYAEITANQAGITTATDITGLSVAVTAGASRRIKITARSIMNSSVATDVIRLSIFEGATLLHFTDWIANTPNALLSVEVVLTPTTGAHTYKLQAARQAGTGTVTVVGGANFPAFILVEDIGPAS